MVTQWQYVRQRRTYDANTNELLDTTKIRHTIKGNDQGGPIDDAQSADQGGHQGDLPSSDQGGQVPTPGASQQGGQSGNPIVLDSTEPPQSAPAQTQPAAHNDLSFAPLPKRASCASYFASIPNNVAYCF